jgi:hypothetical protein
MTSWKQLLLVCVGALGIAACGGSTPPPSAPPPSAKPALTLADLTDAMCACKDPACASKVRADYAEVERASAADLSPHARAQRTFAARCEATAREGDDQATMDKMKDALCACKDSDCVEKVTKDFASWTKKMEEKYKNDRKPTEQMMRTGEEMSKCVEAAMTDSSNNSQPPASTPASCAKGGPIDTGVPECDDYLNAFDEYMSCDKIPQQAKDASCQGIEQMKQGWATLKDPSVPAEAKKAAADACQQATEALVQSAQAMGCPLSYKPHPPPPPAKKKRPKHGH